MAPSSAPVIGYVVPTPSSRLMSSPVSVPSHKTPRRSSRSAVIRLLFSPGVLAELKMVNRTPSKRARPPNVASHRYPSRVWTIALTEFCGSPSSVVHTVWTYGWTTADACCCWAETRTHNRMPASTVTVDARDLPIMDCQSCGLVRSIDLERRRDGEYKSERN